MKPNAQQLELMINDLPQRVPTGITVAAALARAGCSSTRLSRSGEARTAFCGMGLCQECRVTIDGQAHQRACMRLVEPGMHIVTPEQK